MNDLNRNERVLVALGAAMGSNCISCIEYHIPEARQAGLTDSQITEAIRLSDNIRQVPARKVLDAALRVLSDTSVGSSTEGSGPVQTAAGAATGGTCCG
jgi:AhpD family alkylhydroperoxidase